MKRCSCVKTIFKTGPILGRSSVLCPVSEWVCVRPIFQMLKPVQLTTVEGEGRGCGEGVYPSYYQWSRMRSPRWNTLQPIGLERVLRCQNNCLNKLASLVAPVMGLFSKYQGVQSWRKICEYMRSLICFFAVAGIASKLEVKLLILRLPYIRGSSCLLAKSN